MWENFYDLINLCGPSCILAKHVCAVQIMAIGGILSENFTFPLVSKHALYGISSLKMDRSETSQDHGETLVAEAQ